MRENLLTRDDTFLGVCQGIGEDFGFNPNWLRLAFGVSLLWNPAVVIGAYLTLGLVVATSRLIAGDPRAAAPAAAPAAAEADARRPEAAPAPQAEEVVRDRVPLAA
jgi:phage shock protein PspC (stress-responsive transcriptional regulator)